MTIATLRKNYLPLPRQRNNLYAHRNLFGEIPMTTKNMNVNMTMSAANNIVTALDILNDDCYTVCDHNNNDNDNDNDCGNDDGSRDVCNKHLLSFKSQRSDSPRSVSGFASEAFFGKDCHAINVGDASDEDEDIDSIMVDPPPLTTTASTDLRNLMHDYLGHNDIPKDVLPKTRLTFYEDREHEQHKKRNTDLAVMDLDQLVTDVKDAERQIRNITTSFVEESTRFLPEFPLAIDLDPYSFFAPTTEAYDHAPAMTEVFGKPMIEENKNNDKNKKRVQTKAKLVSKTKVATKNKILAKNNNKNKSAPKNKISAKSDNKCTPNIKIKKEYTEAVNSNDANIKTRIMEEVWTVHYMKLADFYLRHGHSDVLRSDADNKLSGWVKRQRNNLKEGKLLPSQIQRLVDLDFSWNRLEEAWYAKYNHLKTFADEFGKTEVPSKYNRSLAEWSQRQRREYYNMKGTMTESRIRKLEAIPSWKWHSKQAACDVEVFD